MHPVSTPVLAPPPRGAPPRRVVVLGTSGSGKTTLARELARRLNVRHIELDAIHWQPNWTPTPAREMSLRVAEALADAEVHAGGWAVCGNYGKVRSLTCGSADTIVWLDYAMSRVLWQVTRRSLRRCWRGEELWAGNCESLRLQFASRDSILLWVLQTWRRHRRDYPNVLREFHARGQRVVRLRSPGETAKWLQCVAPVSHPPARG